MFIGLDPSGFRQSMAMREADDDDVGGTQISDEERYKDCDRFKFNCPACGKELIFDNALTGAVSVSLVPDIKNDRFHIFDFKKKVILCLRILGCYDGMQFSQMHKSGM